MTTLKYLIVILPLITYYVNNTLWVIAKYHLMYIVGKWYPLHPFDYYSDYIVLTLSITIVYLVTRSLKHVIISYIIACCGWEDIIHYITMWLIGYQSPCRAFIEIKHCHINNNPLIALFDFDGDCIETHELWTSTIFYTLALIALGKLRIK